ncbi:MAG TPA: glycosyl hydrolase 53 family protein [Cyclobacteriaceae bacterium]|nr:glycosyl hydrolase 53 family protein [Cyclobacteriaceae bacterium]
MSKHILLIVIPIVLVSLAHCKSDPGPLPEPSVGKFLPTRGVPGSIVTISGVNFGEDVSDIAVLFNTVAGEVKTVTDKSVEVAVPNGASNGPLTIRVGDRSTTTSETFTVLSPEDTVFYFGSDLSYVNQIVDHGGIYKVNNAPQDPYRIFRDRGNEVVRLRLWHNPVWTKEVYDPDGPQLYNDVLDVARAIDASRKLGMKVLVDFHYSDIWADPGAQEIPAAWKNIRDINVLRDSVYNYTFKTLRYLDSKGLLPEFVQVGNEINCGMLYEFNQVPVEGFPACNVCSGQWTNLRTVINGGIKAVRDVSSSSTVKTKILLHVADPANVEWWFDNITAGVTDFDAIGFSYYPIWHTTVAVSDLSDRVATFRTKYHKQVMILETAYPWTNAGNDGYNNLFGAQPPVTGYPYTPQGQLDMMKKITQELMDGGGNGIFYWEPGWITSGIRDYWNTGSSWENCTFFDFNNNVNIGADYMKNKYDRN